ncbi:MAG: hypothetical protein QOG75_7423 [Mycobacterium sp.]|jgi:hypothetical protein|nr:hypothetical protein [Mycobacterium sp.]
MSNRKKVKQPKDAALPFLDVDQANRVRALMRETLAERGLEVTVFPDHLRADDGREFGVWNVAAKCHSAGRSDANWRRVVAGHVDKLMASVAGGDPFEGLSQDEVLARTYTRLWEGSSLPGGAEHYPHVEFAPGLLEVISLALPHGVATFNADRVEQFGGWERLRAQGLENLSSRPLEQIERLEPPTGGSFFVSRGDSIYTASQALLMPHLAHAVEQAADGGMGWLISMPSRHELCWHLISDSTVVESLAGMAWYAQWQSVAPTGPLSPHVFWGTGDGYQQVTGYDAKGDLRFHIGAELEGIIEELAPAP